jgi:glutathione S-transferase
MIKLLGRANSINVQKVHWCLEELGLPYERTDVGGAFGGNTTPEYLAKNPNGRVPTLEDDGFVLWESNVIMRYLAAKHSAGKLWPTDVKVRAEADRWMDWQQTVLTPAITPVFWQLIRTAADQRDTAAIEKSKAESAVAFTMLDAALKGRPFVAGDTFTMGDIPVGCGVHRWFNLPIERPKLANLEAWYGRIKARPAAVKVLVSPIT